MTAYLKYSKIKSRIILDFFLDYLSSESRDKNIFHEKRIVLRSDDELREMLANTKKVKNNNEKKIISSLSASLLIYNHILYNDYSTDYGCFVEGPYKIDGKIILIRNYPDLAPSHLFGELKKSQFRNKQIISVYKNAKIKMRYLSSHLISSDNYQNNLRAYRVLANGQEIDDLSLLEDYTKKIGQNVIYFYKKIKNKTDFEIKKLFLYQQGYELKWLFDLAGLDWRPSDKKIERIRKNIIPKNIPKNKKIFSLKEYENYAGINYLREIFQKNIKLKGQIANNGFVVGRVKIIKTKKDLEFFESGDILVTKITNPSFIQAITKSKAIIAEIGGLTSHTAIISREFNIPCIVGVKNATKELQDGDFIEVDTHKSTVRTIG
jgi:phosphohistidine swiveling domain-containing protein